MSSWWFRGEGFATKNFKNLAGCFHRISDTLKTAESSPGSASLLSARRCGFCIEEQRPWISEMADTRMLPFLFCILAFTPSESLPDAGVPKRAWLSVFGSKIHQDADTESPAVGLIEFGDWVDVIGCTTSCDDPKAWALLSPFGAVRLSALQFSPPQQEAFLASAFQYGRVRKDGIRVRRAPAENAKSFRTYDAGQMVAYRAPVSDSKWLPLVSGGFVNASDVTPVTASTFRGVESPAPALAFARRETSLLSDEPPGAVTAVARFSAFPVLSQTGKYLRVPFGRIARDDLLVYPFDDHRRLSA